MGNWTSFARSIIHYLVFTRKQLYLILLFDEHRIYHSWVDLHASSPIFFFFSSFKLFLIHLSLQRRKLAQSHYDIFLLEALSHYQKRRGIAFSLSLSSFSRVLQWRVEYERLSQSLYRLNCEPETGLLNARTQSGYW